MAIRRRPRSSNNPQTLPPIVHRWILRLLVPLELHRGFIQKHDFSNDQLAEFAGLGHWVNSLSQEFNPREVLVELRRLYEEAEQSTEAMTAPDLLVANVHRLKELVGLSDTDCRILEFAVLIHSERILDDLADNLGSLTTIKVCHALSVLLDIPVPEIRLALNPQSILSKSGLVTVSRKGAGLLRAKLDLLSDHFSDAILSSDTDPIALLRDTVVPSTPPHLQLTDYEHIAPTLAVLRPYLTQSVASCRRGVNVFLHGNPGTGKSQLAKVLAKELGCEIFEVTSEDSDGDPVNGEKRLRAFRAAQSFFARRRALILFDEVEDVFDDGDGFFGRKSTAQTRKAWINRMLEDNPVPTLWLSNSISGLDPAFIRRFDLVFELPVPPKKQRERILTAACSDLIPPDQSRRIAAAESLAPAVVTRAAAVVRSIQSELGPSGSASALALLIDHTLKAQGHQPIRHLDPNQLPSTYDPAFIHADADLRQVAQGLLQSRAGRLCLYGPPGTGKSAYARWLAEHLGVPLLAKRASDLMSMWVGGSEKNIARAFSEAEQDGALLLIDEVDSFLQDRRHAQRGWEVTLVNELLTQMESFPGVFIASTNLMDGLDPASLRRFDLKVKFDYLKAAQATDLLCRYCQDLGLPAPTDGDLACLSRLNSLTPGDFAAVIRQNRFRAIASPTALVTELERECVLKAGTKRAIGFY